MKKMNKKCYFKRLAYVIPELQCFFCNNIIKTGEALYTVVLTWGNGKSACKKCYDQFEIDWSMHETEEEGG